jgi:hypothetical protein
VEAGIESGAEYRGCRLENGKRFYKVVAIILMLNGFVQPSRDGVDY